MIKVYSQEFCRSLRCLRIDLFMFKVRKGLLKCVRYFSYLFAKFRQGVYHIKYGKEINHNLNIGMICFLLNRQLCIIATVIGIICTIVVTCMHTNVCSLSLSGMENAVLCMDKVNAYLKSIFKPRILLYTYVCV